MAWVVGFQSQVFNFDYRIKIGMRIYRMLKSAADASIFTGKSRIALKCNTRKKSIIEK
jgi:hypothetical protein